MKLSVVMPVFNEAPNIGEQLGALAAQVFSRPWELTIADNGSTDGTPDIARTWSDRLPLRVVDASARRGCAAARNIGVGSSTGDAFLFCDGDDVVGRGWLAAHSAALEQADLSAGSMVPFELETGAPPVLPSRPPTLLGWLPYAQGANCAVRREAYEAVGGFNEANAAAEDVEFSWRVQLAEYVFTYTPQAFVQKRARPAGRAVFVQNYRYGKSDVDMFRRFRKLGASRASAARLAKTYLGLVARLPALGSPAVRTRWLHQAGRRCGRLVASAELRTFFP